LKISRKSRVTRGVLHPSALLLSLLDPAGGAGHALHAGLLATIAEAQSESSKVRLVFQPAGAGGEVIVLKLPGLGHSPVYPQKSVTSILSPACDSATTTVVAWRAGTEEGTARTGIVMISNTTMGKSRVIQRFILPLPSPSPALQSEYAEYPPAQAMSGVHSRCRPASRACAAG